MRIFNWLKESNRLKHLGFGFLIFFVIAFIGVAAVNLAIADAPIVYRQVTSVIMCWMALLTVAACMASVEFIQRDIGGRWDWLDILAGCLAPILMTVVFTLLYFILT